MDESVLYEVLTELSGVASAPMTVQQREMRAAPVLAAHSVTLSDLVEALRSTDLPWNRAHAKAFGVDEAGWQQALDAAGLADVDSVAGLLTTIHGAEAAAAMVRAGYRPSRDDSGRLNWSR
ncbi:MAG: hypothetical protein WD904_13555 [Dehalococcoidia bacterium]